MTHSSDVRVGDLISVSPTSPAVSLSDVEAIRRSLRAGEQTPEALAALVRDYCLAEAEGKAAFDAMLQSLTGDGERGDAYHIQGVCGAGKSHLLAVLALLCSCLEDAWPAFVETHPDYARAAETLDQTRLVVPIALDEFPAQTHPLEYIVLSRIEAEVAESHGVTVALTQESHLLNLIDSFVLPQVGDALDGAARAAHDTDWQALRSGSPEKAADVALEFLKREKFPLDWRRSRADAWAELGRTLREHSIGGPLILLDELGTFLAGKSRRALNADASFLQYLAQRTNTDRCWLICATQRGFEEVGDVDRRTLRQLRDRFRSGFTLDLSDIEWVIQHKVVRRREPEEFADAMDRICRQCSETAGADLVSASELSSSYPLNPLCLAAVRRAAETCLSRTRSAVRLLREAVLEQGWLAGPANRLITPDVAFDIFRDEMSLTVAGRRHLRAYEAVMGNADRIARGQEAELAIAMKALCLLGLGELRWSEHQLRAGLVGCAHPHLWQQRGALHELLLALFRRGSHIERTRREGDGADEYYVDVLSDTGERLRQRMNEIVGTLAPDDSRVVRAALEACHDAAFPIAGATEQHTVGAIWQNARRYAGMVCRDLHGLSAADLQNLAGSLESPHTREDGQIFLAPPTAEGSSQREHWADIGKQVTGRFACGILAWMPADLGEAESEHLSEHAALAAMVTDHTLFRRRDSDFRERVRERWADSEAETQRIVQRAYYSGQVIALDGTEVVERDRLWGLFGDWDETLTAILEQPFGRLFPRFQSIAPERQIVGRAQTNRIIDQFIRPGEVVLPPASALEAHIHALARPLGLAAGTDRHLRLALQNRELLEAALALAPPRTGKHEIDPDETLRYGELVGRIAKSEWGLVGEQADLLVAALMRTGYLVGLDAFLQPVRLDAVVAPLRHSLPYVMRGEALENELGERAATLWRAISGKPADEWDLPAQERAWGSIIDWSARLRESAQESRTAIQRAADALGHQAEDWAWAEHALATAEALAETVDQSLTSKEGLTSFFGAAERLPGGLDETAELVGRWRACADFLSHHLDELAQLRLLLTDARVRLPHGSMLAREHSALLARFGIPEQLVSDPHAVKASAQRWLESYRRHYLGWHSRVHAAAAFEGLAGLRRSAALRSARALAQAGLGGADLAAIESDLTGALARRCLAGDPLPPGCVVCRICGLEMGEDLNLPEAREVRERVEQSLVAQLKGLAEQSDLLRRRLAACTSPGVKSAVGGLLAGSPETPPDDLAELLTDEAVVWIRRQLDRPAARQRRLAELEAQLRGKELTRREVIQVVESWLGAGDDDLIEIV